MDTISRVYFFDNGYGIRGGAIFFKRLASYLTEKQQIPVSFIDFSDGYLGEFCENNSQYTLVNYEDFTWDLENNSVVILPIDHLCLLKKLKYETRQVKILCVSWETKIGWNLLYSSSVLRKLAKLLSKKESVIFLDSGCHYAIEKQLKIKFSPNYLPLYHEISQNVDINSIPSSHQDINFAWLGRLSDTKCMSLLNVIDRLSEIDEVKEKNFYIIGFGPYQTKLKEKCKVYKNKINIVFMDRLVGTELNEFLIENVDVLFAMGTSMLNGAALKLPVIGVHETASFINIDKFIWLFDEEGYDLGLPDDEKRINRKAINMSEIVRLIYDQHKKRDIGSACYEYAKNNHGNIEKTGSTLLAAINRTQLFYADIKRLFRFIPFVDACVGRLVLFGIPLYKKVTLYDRKYYYLFNLKLFKLKYDSLGHALYFLGIPIWKFKKSGRYYFPNTFDRSLKEKKEFKVRKIRK